MKIIVGLGNPGLKYAVTRHNAGFLTVDILADALNADFKERDKSLEAHSLYKGEKVIVLKPQTFMNLSGQAVVSAMSFYKVEPEDVLIVFDDMALEQGRIRFRRSGSAGGHNGMQSIIEQLESDQINRLKVGIGSSVFPDSADYVLGRFTDEELHLMAHIFRDAAEAALCWINEGISEAMNQYNKNKDRKNTEE
ncbi:MAG: aminoacyl-tRNA hydrolase [Bacillota bacterium]|jgi:PTH1 family peptidyl-tRNA hydrolase